LPAGLWAKNPDNVNTFSGVAGWQKAGKAPADLRLEKNFIPAN
jgi:hypothetical protein